MLRACLELGFHDSEPTANFKLPDNIRLISEEDTEKIWTFILGLQEEVKTVVVHCEQGMSRSPAVAAAICGCLGGDPSIFLNTYQPNQFVFKAVREAYRRSKGG